MLCAQIGAIFEDSHRSDQRKITSGRERDNIFRFSRQRFFSPHRFEYHRKASGGTATDKKNFATLLEGFSQRFHELGGKVFFIEERLKGIDLNIAKGATRERQIILAKF
jgi:hypothetical protein